MGFMDKAKAQAEKALAKGQELAKEGKAKLDEYQAQQAANQQAGAQSAPPAPAAPPAPTDASGAAAPTPPAGDTGEAQSFSLDDV